MSQQSLQRSTIPPAQPTYVLRGHAAQIHAVHFFKQNLRLISGDAEGWIVVWSVPIRRPVAVWRAHKGTILGVGTWGDERIITFVTTAPKRRYILMTPTVMAGMESSTSGK